jgi:hypothetical protein
MTSDAKTVVEYLEQIPEDQKTVVIKLQKIIKKNLPKGFKEVMNYGMIGYVVPHSIYPDGYHCNPTLPLPFMGLGCSKKFCSILSYGYLCGSKIAKVVHRSIQ